MSITTVVLRRRVDDLAAAVPFYETITGQLADRFRFAGLQLAAVGPFLLFSGPPGVVERFAAVAATLTVPDLDEAVATAVAAGGSVIAAPATTPNGHRAVVRHPDGGVFEYTSRPATGAG